jgi:TonB family protein
MAGKLALLLSLGSAMAFADSGPSKPVDLSMVWTVDLDAAGAITSLKPAEDRNPELYRHLEPAVRSWHFTTGKVNGAPAAAETTLTVHLTLEPVADGYRVHLRRAETGPTYGTTVPPKYPDGALMSHRGGAVLLLVHYDADGHVIDAEPTDGGEPKPGADIQRAAVVAVKKWTFKPEAIAGHGLAGTAKVPVCFKVEPSNLTCRFTDPESHRVLDDDHGLLALDPVVRLETDVADHTL